MKIKNIFLRNFLIIKRTNIDLAPGLTTVTGETGSGKSLFVSAMKALKGERIGKTLLGKWGETAEITAEIVIEGCDRELKDNLKRNEIDFEEESVVVIRRIFGEKNSAYINSCPVSISLISDIFSDHIEIGSQFENRELFKKDYRLKIVDSKAGNLRNIEEYKLVYGKISDLKKEKADLIRKDDPARRDYLEYQINELEKFATYHGEDEKLHNRIKFIENRAKIIKLSSELSELLSSSSKSLSRSESLASQLEKIVEITELAQRIGAVSIEVDDISKTASGQFSKYSEEDDEVEDVERRYNALSSLMIKHGTSSSEGLVAKMNLMSDELFEINKIPQKITVIEKELKIFAEKATEKALLLRKNREKAAVKLEENILKYLEKFGMKGVRFSIFLHRLEELDETGLDSVEFTVNTIGTDQMYDISSLSGGELSRLLLAIKLVDDEEGKVLLFDEIDSSIGGETAKSAASEMKKNSNKNQIVVVTHFPQTAVVADTHLLVEKNAQTGEIIAEIKTLTIDERVAELARMMGDSDSADFLATARKMIGG